MKCKSLLILAVLVFICTPIWAQKKKNNTKAATQSNAEKMGYARTNKYWGPGTYYLYAPGKPNNKMANNTESAMRDLIGISDTDLYTEIAKQGFVEIPKKESVKTWFNRTKNKERSYYYSSDKSYVLETSVKDMYKSPTMENGKYAYASHAVSRLILIPKQDSLKVIEAAWQFLRDLKEMNVLLSSFGSNFKKADPKAFPIQRTGTAGWTGLRAGSWSLTTVDGKLQGHWEANEDILRRTIAMPELEVSITGVEVDFFYTLIIKLEKEGYVLNYSVGTILLGELEPSNSWVKEYLSQQKEYNMGVKADKDNVEVYRKAPFPPVLKDLNTLLHIKK